MNFKGDKLLWLISVFILFWPLQSFAGILALWCVYETDCQDFPSRPQSLLSPLLVFSYPLFPSLKRLIFAEHELFSGLLICPHFMSPLWIPLGLSLPIPLFVPFRKNWSLAGSFSSWSYWCWIVKHSLCYLEISSIHVALYLFSQKLCWVVRGFSSPICWASYPLKLPTCSGSFLQVTTDQGLLTWRSPLLGSTRSVMATKTLWKCLLRGRREEYVGGRAGYSLNFPDAFQEFFWSMIYMIQLVLCGMLTKPQSRIVCWAE